MTQRYRDQPARFTAASILAAVAAGETPTLPPRTRPAERDALVQAMRHLMESRNICVEPAGKLVGIRSPKTSGEIARFYGLESSESALIRARAGALVIARTRVDVAIARSAAARRAARDARDVALAPRAQAMRAAGATIAEIVIALGACKRTIERIAGPRPARPKAEPAPRKPRAPRPQLHAKPKPAPAPKQRKLRVVAPPPPPAPPAPPPVDVDALILARMDRARVMLTRRMEPAEVATQVRLPLREVYRVAAEIRAARQGRAA